MYNNESVDIIIVYIRSQQYQSSIACLFFAMANSIRERFYSAWNAKKTEKSNSFILNVNQYEEIIEKAKSVKSKNSGKSTSDYR